VTRPLLALLAAAVAAQPGSASAQPAQLVNAIPSDKADLDQLILVGESGQLFVPSDDGWRRDGAGGIAGDVSGAARGSDGTLFVIGGRAPIYEWVDDAWRVRSLGVRRRSRSSTLSGMPIVALARQLYTLEGDKWRRIGAAPTSRINVIWASSRKRVYLADDNGDIRRRDGRSWTTVRLGLPPPERVARLMGIPGKVLFAVGDEGTVLRVGRAAATPVAVPDDLLGLHPTAVGSDDQARVYLAGTAPTADESERQVLASVAAKGALTLVDELPALAADDYYSLIVARPGGALLLASYAGVVRIRAKDGSWSDRTVTTALPAQAPVAIRDARKPARTR